jgi:polyribonucleotide nucleotidyltransferase
LKFLQISIPGISKQTMQKKIFEAVIGGKQVTAELSDLVENATGSVIMRMGDTVILVTAVMGEEEKTGMSYFPLSVEFEERFYAAGQILGSRFVRREGRPSDEAVLSARIVDRTIRPLFDHALRHEVQVIITVLALGDEDPDVLAIIGASLALAISSIPWNGPVGAARIGKRKSDGALIINPSYPERATGALSCEVLACGKDGSINMIETAGDEVHEADIIDALKAAQKIHGEIEAFQKKIIADVGREKRTLAQAEVREDMVALFNEAILPKISGAVFSGEAGKHHIYALKKEWATVLKAALPDAMGNNADRLFENAIDNELHRGGIDEGKRADGRALDEVRPLFAQAGGISPMLHGSGIFYRGGTHIFSALTLGGPQDSQIVDTMEEREMKKRFMHHYNFPPYSVGEVGRVGGQNRRMIGHGALAEKALVPVLPPKETFPYTIRLVSETMASNGSSSMGSVCASTLALMDGGVPITRPVAGIASGLLMRDHRSYALLTDIQGPEDEYGDMDFKVAGTRNGITAIQMDVKVDGIPIAILEEALEKAKAARLRILETMEEAISAPRSQISPRAPMIVSLVIPMSKIGLVIGSGGKTINKLKEESGVEEITIEDDGTIFITGKNGSAELAAKQIEAMTREFKAGETLDGKVTRLAAFGAFVALNEYTEGLLHISEIAPWRIEKMDGVLAVGEVVPVVIKEVDGDRLSLSIKRRDPDFAERKGLKPQS